MLGENAEVTRTERGRIDGAALLVVSSAGAHAVALEGGAALVVGRAATCDVVVPDASLSREHARLEIDAQGITVSDLASKNGTRVDGAPLAPGERRRVMLGAVLELGSVTCVVAPARPRAATPASAPLVRDPAMQRAYALLDVIAPSPLSVLVLGETGAGKELYAREVHRRSRRAHAPFLPIHCAALPESMLEAELFGYERGAFTGAVRGKEGLFEAANHGTVFLDEVGDIPLGTQAKLLRVIESREVMRLGRLQPITVDVRFVAATHHDLRALVAEGRFRADLFFRLNGITVTLPPLRSRRADIGPLAEEIATRAARAMNRPFSGIDDGAAALLCEHAWPGNVRELKNVLERAILLASGPVLDRAALERADPDAFGPSRAPPRGAPEAEESATALKRRAREREREELVQALEQTAGNQSRAARLLGISRFTLMNRMHAYGLARPRKS